MAQIHHVGIALLTGVAAVVLRLCRHATHLGEEARIGAGGGQRLLAEALIGVQQVAHLGQVGHGQGGIVLGAHQLAAPVIGVADDTAQRRAVHGGLLGQRAHPLGVIPAVGGLRLLRRHQILGQVAEGIRRVHRSHQAGIKAHQLQRLLARLIAGLPHLNKGAVHLAESQGIQTVQLVKGRAGHRSAAVVPEDHRRLVGGIVLLGKQQEIRQRLAVAHAGRGLFVHQLQALAVIDKALQLIGFHHIILPLGSTAGLDHHRHVFRQLHLQQLRQVAGGKAALRLQIAAAQIPVYRPAAAVVPNCIVLHVHAAGTQRQQHQHRQQQRANLFLHIRSLHTLECRFLSVKCPLTAAF